MSADAPVAVRPRQQELLPILEQSVHEVFAIVLGCELSPGTKPQPDASSQEEFTAMVGLAGSLRGVITFCCGVQSAAQIAARMLGIESACTDEQTWDAIGEICNMIAGNFKNKLIGFDGSCLLSVPAVVTGRAYRFHSLAGGDSVETVLLLEGAPLVIRLDLHA
jgi:chemotaxis protein CheX